MSNLQIKRVPDELHRELRRRADQAGVTLRDYVLELIRRDLAAPSRWDWAECVRELPPIGLGRPAADLIRADREERADDDDRR